MRHLLDTARHRPLLSAQTFTTGKRKGEQGRQLKPATVAKFDRLGKEHYLIYKTAVLTALRRGELRRLRVSCLVLDDNDADGPYLYIPAKYPDGARGTKNGKEAIIMLKEGHAAELATWIAETGKKPANKLFTIPDDSRAMSVLRRNLKTAEIPFEDKKGRRFDWHCFRKCMVFYAFKAGVSKRLIKLFGRWASTDLAEHYDDEQGHEMRQVCDALPNLDLPTEEERKAQKWKKEAQKAWLESTGFD